MSSILIIDDESALVNSLSFALRGEGYDVVGVGTSAEGLRAAERTTPSLVLLDLRLPDGSGLEVLDKLLATLPGTPVIMISAHGDTRVAVKAVKAGAFDYLTKPFELDEMLLTIRSALERERMSQEIARFREATLAGGELVGESPVVRTLAEATRQVGASHAGRVLLLGESGSGKALVARAIHSHSSRAKGPFVEVNCAALPEQLIEAELFGAEKGSYTGAMQRRVGLVALADGGTLFLDEIGELPMALQAKILHFLEDGSYRPVGSGRPLVSDARVVAATNRDLAAEVRAGTFREDLYYRLNVVHLSVPPLRERGNDILLLARHFADRYAREERCAPVRFPPEAEAVLIRYRWPGNVRELRNLVERLTILSPGKSISPADLPVVPAPAAPPQPAPGAASYRSIDAEMEDSERALVLSALRQAGGHRGRAASKLGISRHALKRRLQRLGLL
jgi:two-component system, NtrC family, response regulator AtoC